MTYRSEIEIEDVGVYRLPNAWQMSRIKVMPKGKRESAILAFGIGMTIKQFKRLPSEKRREVDDARLALMSPDNFPPELTAHNRAPSRFRKGLHRSNEEKAHIGTDLLKVKASLPRGHFGPWLEKRGIPRSFADAVIKIAAAASETERPAACGEQRAID